MKDNYVFFFVVTVRKKQSTILRFLKKIIFESTQDG